MLNPTTRSHRPNATDSATQVGVEGAAVTYVLSAWYEPLLLACGDVLMRVMEEY